MPWTTPDQMRVAASLSFKHSITLATFLDPVFEVTVMQIVLMNERKDRSWEHAGWVVGINGLAFHSLLEKVVAVDGAMLYRMVCVLGAFEYLF